MQKIETVKLALILEKYSKSTSIHENEKCHILEILFDLDFIAIYYADTAKATLTCHGTTSETVPDEIKSDEFPKYINDGIKESLAKREDYIRSIFSDEREREIKKVNELMKTSKINQFGLIAYPLDTYCFDFVLIILGKNESCGKNDEPYFTRYNLLCCLDLLLIADEINLRTCINFMHSINNIKQIYGIGSRSSVLKALSTFLRDEHYRMQLNKNKSFEDYLWALAIDFETLLGIVPGRHQSDKQKDMENNKDNGDFILYKTAPNSPLVGLAKERSNSFKKKTSGAASMASAAHEIIIKTIGKIKEVS